MKKLYMKKLGLVMLLVGMAVGQVDALVTHNVYTVNNGVVVEIVDDVMVTGNLTIGNNGSLTIKGDLEVGGKISVGSGAYLIVYGNLKSTSNQDIQIDGSILVAGNLDITYGADIKNNGNLIVGGDFIQAGGTIDFKGNDGLRVYILNPDAIISVPAGSVVNDPNSVGDLADFREFESSNPTLSDFVEQVVVAQVIGFQWKVDNVNGNWHENINWTGNKKPQSDSNVRIRPSSTNPEIVVADGFIELNNLTILAGAVLTLKPGSKLTVNGTLTIVEEGGLVLENTTEVNGLASLITNGEIVGKARISLKFPRDEWYYVSQPIKAAKSDIYALLNNEGVFRTSEAWVNIHRANRWYRIASGVAIAELEGLSIKYKVADENDMASHVVNYTGELNNGTISRTFANRQYYLFGNPYPSSINWQEDAGWSRNNIGGTIYYRARVNGSMTFVTYNRFANTEAARVAVFPDGVAIGNVAELANIPPLQSVWIASLGDGSITIDNNARQHVAVGSLLKSSRGSSNSSVIRIGASNESGGDGAVLYFSGNSDEGLDPGDSEKMFNDAVGIPEVFTRVGDRSMAINGLPYLENDSYSFPLSVRNKALGDVILKFDLSAFSADYVSVLEDKLANVFVDIRQTKTYTYSVVDVGTNHDRFVIHLNYKPSVEVEQEESVEDALGSEEPNTNEDASDDETAEADDYSNNSDDASDNNTDGATIGTIEEASGSTPDDAIDAATGSEGDSMEDTVIVEGGNESSTENDEVFDDENGDDSETLEAESSDTLSDDGSVDNLDDNFVTDQIDSQLNNGPEQMVTTSLQFNQQESEVESAISIKSIAGKVLISVGLEVLQGGHGIVEIYTIEGRKISEVPARSSRTLVILPSQAGIYIVRAKFGHHVKSERVMVKGN